jgi:glycosyltransferase involved in cell wall biosynthesis
VADIPAVSVILLTHNRPQFLERAFASIIGQSFKDYEFILIDNGSQDDTTNKICKKLSAGYPAIRFMRRDNGNIGAGRNAGIDISRGRYIAFVDDDDYAYPDMLGFLYGLAVENQADISFCGSDKEVDGKVLPQFVFDELLIMKPEQAVYELLERRLLNLATPTKLFNKELFNVVRFSETEIYDDITLTYKLFANASKVCARGTPLYCFVRHQNNNSGFTDNDQELNPFQLEAYFKAYRDRTEFLTQKLPVIAEYVRYSEWSFLLSMYRKITMNKLKNCSNQLNYIVCYLDNAGNSYLSSSWIKEFEYEYFDAYKNRRLARL